MDQTQQAATVICFIVITVHSTVGLGFMEGSSTIIGNLIGASKPIKAYQTYKLLIIFEVCIQYSLAALLIWQTQLIADFFASDDHELNAKVAKLLPYTIFICATYVGVTMGALNGLAAQKKIGPLFLVCQYLIALPLALHFGMTK